jgi:hypothetical protein
MLLQSLPGPSLTSLRRFACRLAGQAIKEFDFRCRFWLGL